MQQKFNMIIWALIPCFLIFFITLSLWNNTKTKKYEIDWQIDGHVLKVTVFDTGHKDWRKILQSIKKKHRTMVDKIDKMSEIRKELDIDSYMIQIDEFLMVGDYYTKGKYQVATIDKKGNLFKIIELEQQVLVTEEVDNLEFDKVLIIAATLNQAKTIRQDIRDVSLEVGKKRVQDQEGAIVYWLLDNKEVGYIKGKSD